LTNDNGVAQTFDDAGRLTQRGTTTYMYDGYDRIKTRNGTAFSYLAANLDPITDGTFTATQSPTGEPLAYKSGTTNRIALTDRHGDLTALLNTTTTNLAGSYAYDPFGTRTATQGQAGPRLGFQGDYTDPSSNHTWMGARWYSPSNDSFTSRDTYSGTIATPLTLNRHTYALNNPLTYIDPDGRRSCDDQRHCRPPAPPWGPGPPPVPTCFVDCAPNAWMAGDEAVAQAAQQGTDWAQWLFGDDLPKIQAHLAQNGTPLQQHQAALAAHPPPTASYAATINGSSNQPLTAVPILHMPNSTGAPLGIQIEWRPIEQFDDLKELAISLWSNWVVCNTNQGQLQLQAGDLRLASLCARAEPAWKAVAKAHRESQPTGWEVGKRIVKAILVDPFINCFSVGSDRNGLTRAVGCGEAALLAVGAYKGAKAATALRGAGSIASIEVTEAAVLPQAGSTAQVTVLGRYADVQRAIAADSQLNALSLPAKGTGRWYWHRNQVFIDNAIARGDEIRMVTNPTQPLFAGGNTFQREIRYLRDLGYTFKQTGDHWVAVPGR
jgi:RHS repeat-associated protein